MPRSEPERQGVFLIGSLAVLGAGALYGVRSTLRTHELRRLKGGPPFNVAVKALVYGTALCFGTASLGVADFLSVSGVKSWRGVQELAEETVKEYDFLQMKQTEAVKEDMERMNRMTPDEEATYWQQYFTIAKEAMKEGKAPSADKKDGV